MRSLVVLFFLPLLMLTALNADASSHGMEGYSETGCSCHGTNPGSDTTVQIEGIPDQFEFTKTYDLTITLTGGPEASASGHSGGFNLKASDGVLSPTDSSTYLTENGELTHEHSGANQRTWTVKWTAPTSEEDVLFTIAGNVVDGDHEPTDGDDWALASYISLGSEVTLSDRIKQLIGPAVVIALFLIPTLMIIRKKP